MEDGENGQNGGKKEEERDVNGEEKKCGEGDCCFVQDEQPKKEFPKLSSLIQDNIGPLREEEDESPLNSALSLSTEKDRGNMSLLSGRK